jgi:hypothetical protein
MPVYLQPNVTLDCLSASVRHSFITFFTILFQYLRFNCRYDIRI